MAKILVNIRDAPTGDVLDAIYELLFDVRTRLTLLETAVSELSNTTADLNTAVTDLAARLQPAFDEVDRLNALLSSERLADQIEDTAFVAEITAARDAAAEAVDSIRGDIARINALAVEPPPAPVV